MCADVNWRFVVVFDVDGDVVESVRYGGKMPRAVLQSRSHMR